LISRYAEAIWLPLFLYRGAIVSNLAVIFLKTVNGVLGPLLGETGNGGGESGKRGCHWDAG